MVEEAVSSTTTNGLEPRNIQLKSPLSFLSFLEYLLVLNFLKILHNSVSDTHIHYIAGYYVFKGIGIKVGIGYVLVETT